MAEADDDRRDDPRTRPARPGRRSGADDALEADLDTAAAPERVSIHGIADKVKGLLRSRD